MYGLLHKRKESTKSVFCSLTNGGSMRPFGLESFTNLVDDMEKNQYMVLSALHERRNEFHHSRLFPSLSDLLELRDTLTELLERKEQVTQNFPKLLTDVDWERKELIYENTTPQPPNLENMFDLIAWSLPSINAVIEEGIVLYDFVEDNIAVETVGIIPLYSDEGYFIVPEHKQRLLHVLRYQLSLLTSNGEQYRAMRTAEIEHIEERGGLTPSPESIKLSLIQEHNDIPNPATFHCETGLDFPYINTILPVAKRKIMYRLVS